jgi:inorganic pyrophosphatase
MAGHFRDVVVNLLDPYKELPTWSKPQSRVYVVIDTPKGSRNKFKFDAVLGMFKLGHVLPLGAYFPYDFGAVPQTAADDGDPLDVMVIAHLLKFPIPPAPRGLLRFLEWCEKYEKRRSCVDVYSIR